MIFLIHKCKYSLKISNGIFTQRIEKNYKWIFTASFENLVLFIRLATEDI